MPPQTDFRGTLTERFWEKVEIGPVLRPELGHCWIWTGSKSAYAYGQLWAFKRVLPATHIAFLLADGRFPKPCALHRCDNPPCVRRSHLFEGTKADNIHDALEKGRVPSRHKDSCIRGHPFNEKNTYVYHGRYWGCRVCRRDQMRAQRRLRASLRRRE